MNAVQKRQSIEQLQKLVNAKMPDGWGAYVSCFISFSTMTTTPDFVSVTRDSAKLKKELHAAADVSARKEVRKRWHRETTEQASEILKSLKADGFKAAQDGTQVIVTG